MQRKVRTMKNVLLKKAILAKYESVRAFGKAIGVPPSTIQSAIDNNTIGKMAVDTIIKMCEDLRIDVKTFEPIDERAVEVMNKLKKLDRFAKEPIEQLIEATVAAEEARKELKDEINFNEQVL
jgi:hypothetical protein